MVFPPRSFLAKPAGALFGTLALWLVACNERGAADLPPTPEALLAVAPAELSTTVRERYRLAPDRRLLAAVGEIERLLAGGEARPATAEPRKDRWRILSHRDELGELPELPGFEELNDLLVRRARQIIADRGLATPKARAEDPREQIETLEKALGEAEPLQLMAAVSALEAAPPLTAADAEIVRTMVSGLAWLSALTPDELELGDALFAKAWAWLAIARAFEVSGNEASEALLIRSLGYEAAAIRASASLPADDPVRLFVSGDVSKLSERCQRTPEDRPARLLHLALLAERGDLGRFGLAAAKDFSRSQQPLALPAFESKMNDFEAQARAFQGGVGAGRELAGVALQAARECASPEKGSTAPAGVLDLSRTREFEGAVKECSARLGASLLGAPAAEAFLRATFYSGLFAEAHFALRQRASGPAALELAAALAEPAAGAASELRRWLEVSAAVAGGAREVRPLAELIGSATSLGSRVLLDLDKTIARHSISTEPLRRSPVPLLFRQLDSRPAHRVVAARIAFDNLKSLALFEAWSKGAVEVAPHRSEELPALVAEMDGDVARLREILADPAMPSYAQINAVAALAKDKGADDALVRSHYEAVALDPDGGVSPLVAFLEDRGDLAGALSAVTAALGREKDSGSLRWAYLRSEAARLKRRLGDPKGAWKLVEPEIATYKEDAMIEGAETLLALGRFAQALELAQRTLERYPESSEAAALCARARWGLDDPATAADELAASRTSIGGIWNRYLPEAFAATFAGQPAKRAARALSELVRVRFSTHTLANAVIALGKKEGVETVLALLATLPKAEPEWAASIRIDTYDLIVEKDGAAAGTDWYRKQQKANVQEALILYQLRKYELLLALFPIHDKPTGPAVVRLLKIAALMHLGEVGGQRWQEMAKGVAAIQEGDDFFVRAARYLLGGADAASVWDAEPKLDNVASVGWVFGVKAASEKRFVDADGWFQVALESAQDKEPPHAWAWQIESDWLMAHRSLARLEKAGTF